MMSCPRSRIIRLLICLALALAAGAPRLAEAEKAPVVLTDATLDDTLKMQLPVLVDFWTVSCSPCATMAQRVAQLAEVYEGRAVIGTLDAQDNPESVSKYGIESVPTILIFQDGQVVEQFVGVVPTETLANALDDLLGSSSSN